MSIPCYNRSFQKPKRPCPYCEKLICGGKLKRHIATVHRHEEAVDANLSQNKLNSNVFHEKRLEAMKMYNKKVYEEKDLCYSQLMRGAKDQV